MTKVKHITKRIKIRDGKVVDIKETVVRKVKEKKKTTFVIKTPKGEAERVDVVEEILSGSLLGGDKIDWDIAPHHKEILKRTWGSVDEGLRALRNITSPEVQSVWKPMWELEKSMNKIRKVSKPFVDTQKQLDKIQNKLRPKIPTQLTSFLSDLYYKDIKNKPGVASLLTTQIPPRKPIGAKREPTTGVGLNRFMNNADIDNPVLVAKEYKKNPKGLNISGFINVRTVCEQMNVNAEEAFLYICEGMTSNNSRWVKHKVIKEHFRGSLGVINLVNYYNEKCKQHHDANKAKYSLGNLYKSDYYDKWVQEYKVKKMSYVDFTRKFKEFQDLHKKYYDKLLNTSVKSVDEIKEINKAIKKVKLKE